MTPQLAATLQVLAEDALGLEDAWWIIGGAAMALVGVGGLAPPDVDLLTSERDARRLVRIWDAQPIQAASSNLFRSSLFARADHAALPIEVMAGFEVNATDGWRPLRPATRIQPSPGLYTPDIGEQIEILRLFGRPKDLERIPTLAALA